MKTLAIAAGAAAVVLVSACGQQAQQAAQGREAALGQDPANVGLTAPQRLDRALSLPGMHGIVRIKLAPGSGSSSVLSDGTVVTDYQASVVATVGADSSLPFRPGGTMTLRVPGGTAVPTAGPEAGKMITTAAEDAPSVQPGEELLVTARDQGVIAGGNSSTRLVASNSADIVRIANGEAYWLQYHEPLDQMLRRFSTHPAGGHSG